MRVRTAEFAYKTAIQELIALQACKGPSVIFPILVA